ncbi:MAG: DEAD/DEAH box helicase [Candidatus Omnitrophica bacterium]|nr:DEAD/DEAH box helicase [Candidatus Omnitrophota bacterium]MDD5236703.1 DEAD/DEAH box helicase [Candidatus Omnitrophota bacterium]MDD5610916.1 DEAD/DEAH box helicase [Candidatus Omnitrophota bacterium]
MLYDRFQKEAIDYIEQGFSVIVSAPTGAGKTAIAEYIIEESLEKKRGVIYTAPLKALSNQKFRDFQHKFKDSIGILTGDVSINANAPVLIMTTEIFRNKVLDEPQSLRQYSWIIFDEIHFIDNQERGTVWEESLIFLPQHLKMLCLSATIPNILDFSRWIESIHKKPLKVVIENERPVPLTFLYQCQNRIADNINELRHLGFTERPNRPYWERKRDMHRSNPNRLSNLISYIQEKDGLPCIYFVFSRRRAEDLALELGHFNFLDEKEQQQISVLYRDLCQRFNLEQEASALRMRDLIHRGIAYHHAGMLPTLKEVIERLFTSRLIKVIFTTETFALGINMPARSVAFDTLRKFYGRYVRNLKTRDFYQMAGRAGRRGMDQKGFVYCRLNPHQFRLDEVKQIIYGQSEEVRSQLNASYATVLNLFEDFQDGLLDIYPRSFHYFQSNKIRRMDGLNLIKSRLRLLKELGYIRDDELTEKGKFASNLYGYELILSELHDQGIIEQLDEFNLAVLSVSIAFEPRKAQKMPRISKPAQQIKRACEEIILPLHKRELRYRIYPQSKLPYFNLSPAIEAWVRGSTFDKTLKFTDVDEGELVRYFRMGIQILREIRDNPTSSTELKQRISETIRVINRDVIDAEKQLREE